MHSHQHLMKQKLMQSRQAGRTAGWERCGPSGSHTTIHHSRGVGVGRLRKPGRVYIGTRRVASTREPSDYLEEPHGPFGHSRACIVRGQRSSEVRARLPDRARGGSAAPSGLAWWLTGVNQPQAWRGSHCSRGGSW